MKVRWRDLTGTAVGFEDNRGRRLPSRNGASWIVVAIDGPMCCNYITIWHEAVVWL